jgi:hypothetical protein
VTLDRIALYIKWHYAWRISLESPMVTLHLHIPRWVPGLWAWAVRRIDRLHDDARESD